MDLFYKQGACSLTPHIVAHEANINLNLIPVNLQTGLLSDGSVFKDINPKGYVPCLKTSEGKILTEGPVIALYLAAQNTNCTISPKMGSFEYFKMLEWLNFVGTEMHKQGFGPLFMQMYGADIPEKGINAAKAQLEKCFQIIEAQLNTNQYLTGNTFTCADVYLYVVMTWADRLNLTCHKSPKLDIFFNDVKQRPSVIKAHAAEVE
jgi:glutathione S-transferase